VNSTITDRIGHRARACSALAKAGRMHRAQVAATARSTQLAMRCRPLHYRGNGDPCKMTYSRMDLFSRPFGLPKLPAKCRHTDALAGSDACALVERTAARQHHCAARIRALLAAPPLILNLRKLLSDTKKPPVGPPCSTKARPVACKRAVTVHDTNRLMP
jgi:hypothetical protein